MQFILQEAEYNELKKLENYKKFVEELAKDLAKQEERHMLSPMENSLLYSLKKFYAER